MASGSGSRDGKAGTGTDEALELASTAPGSAAEGDAFESTMGAAAMAWSVPTTETIRVKGVGVGQALGRYQLLSELGEGGMATVYKARDTELRREVAVKVLFPHLCKRADLVTRFQREARAQAALDHPNILRVMDVGGARGEEPSDPATAPPMEPPYIVMELVRGTSLKDFFAAHTAQHGRPLGEVVAAIGAVMCDALAEAHAAGIVHRDVKPANIMASLEGRVVLADFGVARVEDDSLVTRSGALVGTPTFMSPEQASGRELDRRSDIYSLGATLYWLATGVAPFSGNTAQVVWAITHGEATPPLRRNPAMGTDLARCIERMMARQPQDRFQSAAETRVELERIVHASGMDGPAGAAAAAASDRLLAGFFTDPVGFTAALGRAVVAASLAQAHEAARRGASARAMALADRVLALEPGGPSSEQALALVESLGKGRRKGFIAGAAALIGMAAMAGAWLAWGRDQRGTIADHAPHASADASPAATSDAGMASGPGGAVASAGAGPEATIDASPEADMDASPAAGSRPGAPDGARAVVLPAAAIRPARSHSGHRMEPARSAAPPDAAPPVRRPAFAPVDAGAPGATPGATAFAPAVAVKDAPAQATIILDLRPWCDLRIDGNDHGRARRDQAISLPPGAHSLVCSQGPGRAEWHKSVVLAPGQQLRLSGNVLEPVRLTVAVRGGDRISVDGRTHHNGETLTTTPGRHRIDVLSGEQRVSGGWISIPSVASCTVRDQPALDCYH